MHAPWSQIWLGVVNWLGLVNWPGHGLFIAMAKVQDTWRQEGPTSVTGNSRFRAYLIGQSRSHSWCGEVGEHTVFCVANGSYRPKVINARRGDQGPCSFQQPERWPPETASLRRALRNWRFLTLGSLNLAFPLLLIFFCIFFLKSGTS